MAVAIASTFAPLALGMAAPGGAVVRGVLLRRLPRPPETLDSLRRHIESLGARFQATENGPPVPVFAPI